MASECNCIVLCSKIKGGHGASDRVRLCALQETGPAGVKHWTAALSAILGNRALHNEVNMWDDNYIDTLRRKREQVIEAGGQARKDKQHEAGKMTARERLE